MEALLANMALALEAHREEVILQKDKQLPLRPTPTPAQVAHIESPTITQIFRDATIYNTDEERWIVRGINEIAGERFIDIEGHDGEFTTITER